MARNHTASKAPAASVAKVTKADGLTASERRDLGVKLLANIRDRANHANGYGFNVKNAAQLLNLLADSMGADATPLQHSEGWSVVYFLADALDRVGNDIAQEGEAVASLTFDVQRVAL